MKQADFEIEYQYVPSKQSALRLQKAFEIIFEKIIKPDELNHANQMSQISKNKITNPSGITRETVTF